jgi:hypothetical protein
MMFTYDSIVSSLGEQEERRKPYHEPELRVLGDVRSLTLGGSPGSPDSGGDTTHKLPGSMPQPGDFPPSPPGLFPPGMFPPPEGG